jgi:hypothetical protein
MKRKKLILLSILFIFLASVQNSTSVPKKNTEPTFSDVTVTTSSSHLLLFGMLENGFTDEMIQGLHSGIPIHFSYFVELNSEDEGWKGEKLASIETRHLLSYDTLKETYKIEIEESSKRFFSFQSLEDAKKTINEINGMKVIELKKLSHDVSYTIRIKAELYKKTLPMGLHQIVPFVSWWDIKTKWYSLSFNI